MCVSLDLKTKEVSGKLDRLWIGEDEVSRFLRQLKTLDETRKEAATLKSMSPEEFTLSLFPLDSLGHIGLKATIRGRAYRKNGKLFDFAVEGAFEIDPSSIPQILDGFEEINEGAKRDNLA